jgi:glucosamine-6-phosphate deaminase
MQITISKDRATNAKEAAKKAAELLLKAIAEKGHANFIAATGASQFEFLEALTANKDIPWAKTTMFHLDEYLGLPESHPASFRKYLRERLIEKIHPGQFHLVNGDNAATAKEECRKLGETILKNPIDVAFVGIGENGHLAFNDPPANFDTEEPYLIVDLDEACKKQQMGEGWFKTLDDVPKQAVSMSIQQIMKSKAIVCTVPDARKAQAVKDCMKGGVSNMHPASILQKHPQAFVFLDEPAASLIR